MMTITAVTESSQWSRDVIERGRQCARIGARIGARIVIRKNKRS
jgi:hypothetical protein